MLFSVTVSPPFAHSFPSATIKASPPDALSLSKVHYPLLRRSTELHEHEQKHDGAH